LEFLQKLPPERVVGNWPKKVTAGEVKESLLIFMAHLDWLHDPQKLAELIRSRFDLFHAPHEGRRDVLVTGYYQPVIDGSLRETREFRYPIYGKPGDLVEGELVTVKPELGTDKIVGRIEGDEFVPYFSRDEIDGQGRLRGKGYELAWAKDPIDVFFLHIQGSGLLRLQEGGLLSINYHASNGRPYKSIGRVLIDRGKIAAGEISMERLRRYLKENPEERDAILAQNESYIFFRFVKEGPRGSLEVPLTPGRSIATDARIFPRGALAFLITQKPVFNKEGQLTQWEPFARFVLNQDSGSAIQGSRRADLYFGSGEEAGQSAGVMKSPGSLFFLLKKDTGGK
jgi:membrane-bound lytic murein transglycosylase A